jgi:hypothetical protein
MAGQGSSRMRCTRRKIRRDARAHRRAMPGNVCGNRTEDLSELVVLGGIFRRARTETVAARLLRCRYRRCRPAGGGGPIAQAVDMMRASAIGRRSRQLRVKSNRSVVRSAALSSAGLLRAPGRCPCVRGSIVAFVPVRAFGLPGLARGRCLGQIRATAPDDVAAKHLPPRYSPACDPSVPLAMPLNS